jgi:hypothetical protein
MTNIIDEKDVSEEGFQWTDIFIWRQPAIIKYPIYLILAFIILIIIFIIGQSIPWEPLQVYAYEAYPTEVCPFDRVELFQDLELVWGPHSINSLSGQTFWISEDGRNFQSTYFMEDDNLPTSAPRDEYPSSALKLAPPEPGEWTLGGRATLRGNRLWFIPVTQIIEIESDNVVTVKDWSECKDKFDE